MTRAHVIALAVAYQLSQIDCPHPQPASAARCAPLDSLCEQCLIQVVREIVEPHLGEATALCGLDRPSRQTTFREEH